MTTSTGNSHKRIGEILVDMGCTSADEIAEALGVQAAPDEARRLGEILVSSSRVNQVDLDTALTRQRRTTA